MHIAVIAKCFEVGNSWLFSLIHRETSLVMDELDIR